MAGLTKDELKSALISHGVEQNLSAAKKDELVELYEEFVAPHDENAGDFSSDGDDEALSPMTRSSSKRTSRSAPRVSAKAATPRVSAKAESPRKVSEKAVTPRVSEKAATPRVSAKAPTPRVSAKASNGEAAVEVANVNELNDEELLEALKKHGIEIGPIVDSTRPLYLKKLSAVLEGGDQVDAASEEEEEEANGTDLDKSAAEFSADEEEEAATEEVSPTKVLKRRKRMTNLQWWSRKRLQNLPATNHLLQTWAKLFDSVFRVQYQLQNPKAIDSHQLQGGVFIRTKSSRPQGKQLQKTRMETSLKTPQSTK